MLDWVLSRTENAVTKYASNKKDFGADMLNGEDWTMLKHICDFLQPFSDVTKDTEGRQSTLEDVLSSMDFLLQHYEENLEKYMGNPFMTASLDAGYTKLLKYFNKLDKTPVYTAAVVLDPSIKWTMFFHWEDQELSNAKSALFTLWEQEYRSTTGLPQRPLTPERGNSSQYKAWIAKMRAKVDKNKDELQQYLDEGLATLGDSSALEWWCQTAQRCRYPLLSRMAIDVLSIPAMSAEAERLFSSAKKTLDDSWNSLHAATIEALECMKSWLRAGYYVTVPGMGEVEQMVEGTEAANFSHSIESSILGG